MEQIFCKDCKFYRPSKSLMALYARCDNPNVKGRDTNGYIVTGAEEDRITDLQYCDTARGKECGPDAKLFEPLT